MEQINQLLKDATFYGRYDEDRFTPEDECYGSITRTCTVTRADERYVSARWYEYNCFRGANHPGDQWLGILIDLETGKAVTLADIVSQDVLEQALDDGVFRCAQIYVDGPNQDEEANRAQLDAVKKYLDMHQTDNFYLTDDALGLCGSIGRYSFYLEAPLSELGLPQWMQTGS